MDTLSPTNWIPVAGRWSIKENHITYTGPDDEEARTPLGICLNDLRLTEGTISCRVQFTGASKEGRVLLGYRSIGERYIMAGLGGWTRAYTIGEAVPAFGWRPLKVAGTEDNLVKERWYSLSVEMTGQRLKLSVDNVPVLQHVFDKPIMSGQIGLNAWGSGPVEFDSYVVERRRGKVFVVMQFSEPYRQLYEDVIRPVSAKFNLGAYHVGEVFGPGIILNDIQQGIIEAEVVIADITPMNQNVFYELGYSHALNKPTILLAERGKQLPFDVSGYRVLMYDNTIAGKKHFEDGLAKHLEAILRE
jgi:hypothetical protein